MTDHISKFIDQMHANGIGPAEDESIIADDAFHRYRIAGDRRGVRNGSYILRVDPDGFAAGMAMSFKAGQGQFNWHSKVRSKATDEEKAAWRARVEADRAKKDADRASQVEEAARKADWIWQRCRIGGEPHPYLIRKGVKAWHGARSRGDLLVVPVRDITDKMVGLQFIGSDEGAQKNFLSHTPKQGAYHFIGGRSEDMSVIAVCEGFATGCTIREAMRWPVVVAFDAGNLVHVAKAVKGRWPESQIVICADNDDKAEVLE